VVEVVVVAVVWYNRRKDRIDNTVERLHIIIPRRVKGALCAEVNRSGFSRIKLY